MTAYDRMSDNLKFVIRALDECSDIVAEYKIERRMEPHPRTGRGKVLTDARIIVRATKEFQVEQLLANEMLQKMDAAVMTLENQVLLEPSKSDYKIHKEYRDDMMRYL